MVLVWTRDGYQSLISCLNTAHFWFPYSEEDAKKKKKVQKKASKLCSGLHKVFQSERLQNH